MVRKDPWLEDLECEDISSIFRKGLRGNIEIKSCANEGQSFMHFVNIFKCI